MTAHSVPRNRTASAGLDERAAARTHSTSLLSFPRLYGVPQSPSRATPPFLSRFLPSATHGPLRPERRLLRPRGALPASHFLLPASLPAPRGEWPHPFTWTRRDLVPLKLTRASPGPTHLPPLLPLLRGLSPLRSKSANDAHTLWTPDGAPSFNCHPELAFVQTMDELQVPPPSVEI